MNRVYKAILPDERAAPFAPIAILLSTLAKRIRDDVEAPDVSAVMGEVEALLDETVSAEDYRMPGDAPKPLVNLSEIDFDALKAKFAKGNQKTEAERLKALLQAKVRTMVQQNKSRADLLAKLQELIDRYNTGSQNIEGWFEELLAFTRELQQEEARSMCEGLTEEELAIFDILTRPEPPLSDAERDTVKTVAKELLETLKEQRLVIDWWKRQQARSAVRTHIETLLDRSLPEQPYHKALFAQKCGLTYEHVYESYGGGGRSPYEAYAAA